MPTSLQRLLRRRLIHAVPPLFLAAALATPAAAQAEISKFGLFFELNATDGDIGLHGLLDADAWQSAEINGPGGVFTVLGVAANADSNEFGINEFFFESNEPPLEERSFQELLMQFPAGVYEAEVLTVDNEMLSEETALTQDLPCPPRFFIARTRRDGDLVLRWRLQRGVYHPDDEVCDKRDDVEVVLVEAIIALENEDTGESRIFSVGLSPDARRVEAPDEFIAGAAESGFEAKAEIIVTEASGNRTALELDFDLD